MGTFHITSCKHHTDSTHRKVEKVVKWPGMLLLHHFATQSCCYFIPYWLIWCIYAISIKLTSFRDRQISKSSGVTIFVLWLFSSTVLSFLLKPFAAFKVRATLAYLGLWQTLHFCDTIDRKKNSSWFSSLWTFYLFSWMCLTGVLNKYLGTRADVDREFIIMFTLVDENQSWYLDENIRHFCTDPDSVDKEDAVFQRSNKMHGECLPFSKYIPTATMYVVQWEVQEHRNAGPSFPRFSTERWQWLGSNMKHTTCQNLKQSEAGHNNRYKLNWIWQSYGT